MPVVSFVVARSMHMRSSMNPMHDINTLKGLREELRLQAHLFKKELRDSFDSLENRWRELEPKLASIDSASIERLVDDYLHVRKAAHAEPSTDDLSRKFDAVFDDVVSRVKDALKKDGFGVLTQIDMQETLKQKLGVEMTPYRILGACHPAIAQRALQTDPRAGVAMPCNVVVFEQDKKVIVCAVDPTKTEASSLGAPLEKLAGELRSKLAHVVGNIESH